MWWCLMSAGEVSTRTTVPWVSPCEVGQATLSPFRKALVMAGSFAKRKGMGAGVRKR